MKTSLRSPLQHVDLLTWHECDNADRCIEFWEHRVALDFLRQFTPDRFNMTALRMAFMDELHWTDISRWDDQQIISRLAREIVTGRIKVVAVEVERGGGGGGGGGESGAEGAAAAAAAGAAAAGAGAAAVAAGTGSDDDQDEEEETEIKYKLHVRLPIDPNEAQSLDDRFTLFGGDNVDDRQYEQVKTTSDDTVDGDDYVDLVFTDLIEGLDYWLEVDPGKEGEPYFAFESVGWGQIEPVARQ